MKQYTITTDQIDIALMLIPLVETFEAADPFGQWDDFDFSTLYFFDAVDDLLISIIDFLKFHPHAFDNDEHIERFESRLLETVEMLRLIRAENKSGRRAKVLSGEDE